jgi:hypothetical protein
MKSFLYLLIHLILYLIVCFISDEYSLLRCDICNEEIKCQFARFYHFQSSSFHNSIFTLVRIFRFTNTCLFDTVDENIDRLIIDNYHTNHVHVSLNIYQWYEFVQKIFSSAYDMIINMFSIVKLLRQRTDFQIFFISKYYKWQDLFIALYRNNSLFSNLCPSWNRCVYICFPFATHIVWDCWFHATFTFTFKQQSILNSVRYLEK